MGANVISAIGAVASNEMLGLDGWLPWDIPEELAYFERTVAGAALVIGRLTYESMQEVPVDSFVVTRQSDYRVRPGCVRADSVESALRMALATGKPVFVIGGAALYAQAWPYCQYFFLTRIERPFAGDTLFPKEVPLTQWRIKHEHCESYMERKSGESVLCRFIQYEQDQPLCLPDA